jgi:valyl-tRNA synthetase
MSSTQDVRFSYGAVDEGRKLANKLWNVARLILTHADGADSRPEARYLEERWIRGRLDVATDDVQRQLSGFDFAGATNTLYHVTFDDFCDWYAEIIKPRLYDREPSTMATALAALEHLLKLLHPVMPHVTEEIWDALPGRESRLIAAPWPEPEGAYDDFVAALEPVQDAAEIFRRSGVRVPLAGDHDRIFAAVVKPERVQVDGNRDAEIERLRKEIARAEGMLANERFIANAPADVVEEERDKLARYRRELDALEG